MNFFLEPVEQDTEELSKEELCLLSGSLFGFKKPTSIKLFAVNVVERMFLKDVLEYED